MKQLIADVVVASLERQDAKYAFGVPGSTTVSLINSISNSKKIKFITSLNENASLGMADGYARASGRIAPVILHTTPGLSTALPNLYNSFVDNVPLLIIVGDVNSKSLIREPGLALNRLEDLAERVTRWCYYAKSPSDVLTALDRTTAILKSPQPGPCCLIIPEDILEMQDDTTKYPNNHHASQRTKIYPEKEQITQLVSLINDSQWPVLIIGREVREKESVNSLVEFSERLAIPVLLESPYPSAYSMSFPQDNQNYLGLFRRESDVIKGADMIIGLGGQLFTERKFYNEDLFDGAEVKVVHIHENPWELGKNIGTDFPIIGTPEVAAVMLNEASKGLVIKKSNINSNRQNRRMRINEIHSKKNDERDKLDSIPSDGSGIKPWKLVNTLYQVLSVEQKRGHEFTIVDEGVITSSYLSEFFIFTKPGSLIGRSAGCLGWGVNAAIGAKLALPNRKVIAFVGDGALMFCPQGLWTAAHYEIPITVIVCNNTGYLSVDLSYDSFGKRRLEGKVSHVGTEISEPPLNIVELSDALGVKGVSVINEKDLLTVLERNASSSEILELIDVHTDPKERGYEGSIGQNSAWT